MFCRAHRHSSGSDSGVDSGAGSGFPCCSTVMRASATRRLIRFARWKQPSSTRADRSRLRPHLHHQSHTGAGSDCIPPPSKPFRSRLREVKVVLDSPPPGGRGHEMPRRPVATEELGARSSSTSAASLSLTSRSCSIVIPASANLLGAGSGVALMTRVQSEPAPRKLGWNTASQR